MPKSKHKPPARRARGKSAAREMEKLANGWSHHLQPLEPIDVRKTGSCSELLTAMSKTAFAGRSLGEAADVLHAMARDKKCFIVGTFSGAMTIAKQGLLITEMIDQGLLRPLPIAYSSSSWSRPATTGKILQVKKSTAKFTRRETNLPRSLWGRPILSARMRAVMTSSPAIALAAPRAASQSTAPAQSITTI